MRWIEAASIGHTIFVKIQCYAWGMGNDFWFRIGVVGLGTLPALLAIGSLFIK